MGRRTGRKTSIGGQFAPKLTAMLEAPAFRVLSLSAHRVLARLEVELGHHGGNDNGKLPVTFDQFEAYGIHRHAIGPAVREVVALGFVEVTQEGRSGNGEFRRPTLYRITYRPTEKLSATEDWRKIETIEHAEAVADGARKNKKPVVVSAKFRCGKRTTNRKLPVAVSTTTRLSADSATTIYISGRGDDVGSPPSAGPTKEPAREGGPAPDGPVPLATITDALLQAAMSKRAGRG